MLQVPVHLANLTGMPSADEMVDMAKTAARTLFEEEGFVQTVTILYCDAHRPVSGGPGQRVAALVCAADFPNKKTWQSFLLELADKMGPVAVVSSTEVWIIEGPLGSEMDDVLPSESPNRVEYVMVTIENKTGMTAWRARIDREVPGDEKSKGTLQDWEVMTVQTRGVGTFADYFWSAPKA